MKTLTIFIFSVLIVFSVIMLIAFITGIVLVQNPDSSMYRIIKEGIQQPNASINSIEGFIKAFIIYTICTMVYLIGSIGILFFKKWARFLIIIASLICFILDVVITPIIVGVPQKNTMWNIISFYVLLALPSLFLFLPKVKEQFK